MDAIPTPRELRTAARACVLLAYVVGLVGVAAGVFVLREGEIATAVVMWTSTFALGTALMGIALVLRALVAVLARIAQLRGEIPPVRDPDAAEPPPVWPGR